MMLVCMGIVSCWQPTNRKNGTSFERSLFIAHLHKKEVLCGFFLATTLYFARSKEKKNLNLFSLMHTAAHIQLFIHSAIHSFIQLFSLHMMAAWMTAVEWALLNIKHGLCILVCVHCTHFRHSLIHDMSLEWERRIFLPDKHVCVRICVPLEQKKRKKHPERVHEPSFPLLIHTLCVCLSFHFFFISFWRLLLASIRRHVYIRTHIILSACVDDTFAKLE